MEPLESVRSLLKSHRSRASSQGYPPEVRQRVGTYAAVQRTAGRRLCDLAQELGISGTTIAKWSGAVTPVPALRFVPVEAVPDVEAAPALLAPVMPGFPVNPAVCSPTLVSPRGFRVEGLDVESLCTLLGRLG